MALKHGVLRLGLAVGLLLSCGAFAEEGDLTFNIFVNYGAAYRDGTWVPVDVFVNNEQRDISGWVEVKTYSLGGELQSPIYRVPAESPKSSKKRFRLHCRLEECSRVEATVYHGKRPAHDFPTVVNVIPIRAEDFLCLVLDDEPETYGFLSTSLFGGRGNIRFYRESLDTERLSYLADYPQCYTPFDLIVIGNIDATRVNTQHRELLRQYVEQGGTLVVSEGRNAMRHRGTWLEELTGVSFGDTGVLSGKAIAAHVFPSPEQQQGASDTTEGNVVKLTPLGDKVKRLGTEPVLATLNPLGQGYVATIAIDTATELLQNCVGYHNLWRDLCAKGERGGALNFRAAATDCANMLPSVAGVTVFPVSSVILYLFLYFFVAIVLNWLVWNYLKRREMAWVCLVILSVGFTAYAMFFGTQGRARSSELEQIEVVQVPRASQEPHSDVTARMDSFVGLLAAGSGRFDATLTGTNALANETTGLGYMDYRYYQYGYPYRGGSMGSNRPFFFIQDVPPRLDSIRIGASEMRFVQVSSQVGLPGGVGGQLVLDDQGVRGSLQNNTGLKIGYAELILDGATFPLKGAETQNDDAAGWHIDVTRDAYRNAVARSGGGDMLANAQFNRLPGMPVDSMGRPGMPAFQSQFRGSLLASNADLMWGLRTVSPTLPPCVVAWIDGPPFGSVEMSGRAKNNIAATLLVAQVDVVRHPPAPEEGEELLVRMEREDQPTQWYSIPDDLGALSESYLARIPRFVSIGQETPVSVALRDWMNAPNGCDIYVDVWHTVDAMGFQAVEALQNFQRQGRVPNDQNVVIEPRMAEHSPYTVNAEFRLGKTETDSGVAVEQVSTELVSLGLPSLGGEKIKAFRRTFRISNWLDYTDGRRDSFRGTVGLFLKEDTRATEPAEPSGVASAPAPAAASEEVLRREEERRRQEMQYRAQQASRRGGRLAEDGILMLVGARAVPRAPEQRETTASAAQEQRGALVAWQ